ILLSLVGHVVLIILLVRGVVADSKRPAPDPRQGLLAAFVPPEREESKIPLRFMEAPGPQRPQTRPDAPLSDADRRAGGGDPKRDRSSLPFIPEKPGISGLEEGRRGAQKPTGAAAEAPQQAKREATGSPTAEEPGTQGFPAPPRGEAGADREPVERLAGLDQAIRDAARGLPAAGEDGAGFPSPDGGFVDSGPFSFDTKWYDWGPYAREMLRRIKLHWDVPSLARLGWKGKVTIRYFIRGDGRVEGAHIVSVSGVPPFDNAALQAILTSSPFRPLPKDLNSDREGVTVTFFYNMRPGAEDGEGE
ncbi:MAG TPA: TonB family protein, partial [Thermoanaerobaculia bacterium]